MGERAWRIGAILVLAFTLGAATSPPAPPLPPPRVIPPEGVQAQPAPPLPLPRPRDLDAPPGPDSGLTSLPARLGAMFGPPMPPRPLVAPLPVPLPPVVPPDEEIACATLLTSRKVEARTVAPPVPSAAGCFLPAPVEIAAVLLPDGRRVPLQPAVTIGCPFGAAFAEWVRDDLAPVFDKAGTPLDALVSTSGYSCRGRNHVAGARISEHARGDAIDVGGFRMRGGTVLEVKASGPAPLLQSIRATACARFATVLGPGSDSFHESHLHVDLEPRRNGAKLCQWTLP